MPTTLTRSQLAGLDPGEGYIRYRSPAAASFTVARPMLTAHRDKPRSGLLNGARHSQTMLNSPRHDHRNAAFVKPGGCSAVSSCSA